MQELYNNLMVQLADIDHRLETCDLTDSERHLLYQVWEEVTDRVDELAIVFPIDVTVPVEMSEEEHALWNNMVDNREDCEHCIGCMFCADAIYDSNDEI